MKRYFKRLACLDPLPPPILNELKIANFPQILMSSLKVLQYRSFSLSFMFKLWQVFSSTTGPIDTKICVLIPYYIV